MTHGYSKVVLATLGGGALDERFHVALQAVIKNIEDLNTDPKAKREINMKVVIKPSADRDSAQVFIRCEPKLAPMTTQEAVIHLAKDPATGKTAAFASDFKQAGLFDPQEAVIASVESSAVAPSTQQ